MQGVLEQARGKIEDKRATKGQRSKVDLGSKLDKNIKGEKTKQAKGGKEV